MRHYRIVERVRDAHIVHVVQHRRWFLWQDIPGEVYNNRFKAADVAYDRRLRLERRRRCPAS